MEFFHIDASDCADVSTTRKLFEGDTLVVPAVSFANLGQLTVDLIVNTLLHHAQQQQQQGNKSPSIHKVGHLFSTAVPPIAGATAFGVQDRNALCLNLEVYRIPSHGVSILQQRTGVAPGQARAFADELVAWARASGFTSLVVVSGADDMLRHDPNMQRRSLLTVLSTSGKDAIRNRAFLEQAAPVTDADAAWEHARGCGVAPLVHARCVSTGLAFAAFVLPCAEGDNVPDAVHMASHVLRFLEIDLPSQPPSPLEHAPTAVQPLPAFVFPPSWSQLFGRGPDVALFL